MVVGWHGADPNQLRCNMLGSIFTAIRSVMATVTVSADAMAAGANALHNVARVAEAQSEQWLLESLEDTDIKGFLEREPLRVRLEREEREAKLARKAMKQLPSA